MKKKKQVLFNSIELKLIQNCVRSTQSKIWFEKNVKHIVSKNKKYIKFKCSILKYVKQKFL